MDRARNGGGWTSLVKSWYQQPHMPGDGDYGKIEDFLKIKGRPYRLDTKFVNHVIGDSEEFDILGAQNGVNSHYASGNYE